MTFSVWQNEWMIHYKCFHKQQKKSSANKQERAKKIKKIKLLFAMAANERSKSKKKARSCDVEMANCTRNEKVLGQSSRAIGNRQAHSMNRHRSHYNELKFLFSLHFTSLIHTNDSGVQIIWSDLSMDCTREKTANFYQRRSLARKKIGPTIGEWLNFIQFVIFFRTQTFLLLSHLGLFKIEDPIKLVRADNASTILIDKASPFFMPSKIFSWNEGEEKMQ